MFKGSIVALATPFDSQGNVDFENLAILVQWHVESGTDAIVLCGTTGEAPTLSFEEKVQIFKEAVIAAKGRIPIIAGTGTCDTKETVELTQQAQRAGVDAALVAFPYYSRPSLEGCFLHFQLLSTLGLPLIPYHHPGRSAMKLPLPALARIAELPNVVAVKDGTADMDYALEWMHRLKTPLLSGDDSLVIPHMASGAVGVVSIVANIIPREWKILTTLMLADQVGEGRDFFNRYYPLVKAMVLETNPQCVKYALAMMGKCSSYLRLPLTLPPESVQQQISDALSLVSPSLV